MGTGTRTSRKQRETNYSVARAMPLTAQPGPSDSQASSPPTFNFDKERHHRMIEEAAYYIAEHRGFCEGFELDDWLAAEAEVNQKLESLQSH
ncbi:MAG: DUF2934 domain-containing protein [Pseudomonadota bacterium]